MPASSMTIRRLVMNLVLLVSCWLATACVPAVAAEGGPAKSSSGSTRVFAEGAQLEQLWDEGVFTEGVATAPDGTIYFSDIPRDTSPGRILQFHPATGRTTVFSGNSGKSNGLMFDRQGQLYGCCGSNGGLRALCRFDGEGKPHTVVSRYRGSRLNSPNDLVIHPDGSIYFSDPRYVGAESVELDNMAVYRWVPGGELQLVTAKVTKPNGVMLSADGHTLYVAETDNGAIRPMPGVTPQQGRMTLQAFDLRADGTAGQGRVIVDFGRGFGLDGMTVDTEGRVYAALRDPQRHGIVVYSPAGRELDFLPTAKLPTNCCFGRGQQASVLYVTAGGGLFRVPTTATGHHTAIAPRPVE